MPRSPVSIRMMSAAMAAILFAAALASSANAQSGPGGMGMRASQRAGLISAESRYSVAETIDRLVAALEEKGLTVFTRINHAENAKNAGIDLLPSQLLIFGNPKLGTKLMKAGQTVALDLPLRALAYEDDEGQVHLVYNDPDHLARRHGLRGIGEALRTMKGALANLAKTATE